MKDKAGEVCLFKGFLFFFPKIYLPFSVTLAEQAAFLSFRSLRRSNCKNYSRNSHSRRVCSTLNASIFKSSENSNKFAGSKVAGCRHKTLLKVDTYF